MRFVRRASLVFSVVLIVAIAVGFVARRSELAGERDVALTTAAELGASRLNSLIDVVETTALAGNDPDEATAALVASDDRADVCAASVESLSCRGAAPPRDAALELQSIRVGGDEQAVTGRATVAIYDSLITISAEGPTLSVIARRPVELASSRSDITLWAATILPDGAPIGSFAVENGVRQTAVAVPFEAPLYVVATDDDGVDLPADEYVFYLIIFGLAIALLLLAGATLIGEQRNLLERASFDLLTRLPNRGEFERRAAETLVAAERSEDHVCVLLFDLNGFKLINDTYGHTVGDLMLQAVAGRLRKAVRDGDVVARWGGDEFVVAMPGIESEEMGARRARQLAEEVSGRTRLDGVADALRVKVSVGVALWPDHGSDLEVLIEAADRAMYQAKREGLVCRVASPPRPEPEITGVPGVHPTV